MALEEPKNVVVVPHVSMHGSTKKMVEYPANALAEAGVTVHQFDLALTHMGKLAITLVDAATPDHRYADGANGPTSAVGLRCTPGQHPAAHIVARLDHV